MKIVNLRYALLLSIAVAVTYLIITFATACKNTVNNPATQSIYIPNGDFEEWDQLMFLQKWESNSCPPCMRMCACYIIQQDTIAYHGKYSAKFTFDCNKGTYATVKFPINSLPQYLDCYVKGKLLQNDTMIIRVTLYQSNDSVGTGLWFAPIQINNFTKISVPISSNSTIADSARIFLLLSQNKDSAFIDNQRSEFWVDDMILR
ncbi:MAG: hypothetical protein NT007_05625 [Candidatus Kapabacteria bacterium]|nr:hypothetical protein [Candidatus Kapabacteria bacterium]